MNDFGYSRGHLIFHDDATGLDFYEDGTPADSERPCALCGCCAEQDEPDPCLGWLHGVDYACCGHGVPGEEYVVAGGQRFDTVGEWRERTT